ncbi:LLM class F420-dependent oxidoreductase [Actinoallomurus sp. CA-142502]|uniref:LLM class F420-dependent oxidoreductase n=1 Tax=Actinoallomurus sp. CA-142502 TaxID=3239885 RepID=UPI003D8C3E43
MSLRLGTFGAWFNPSYDDDTRVRFVAEAESLGFGTAWLGLGRKAVPGLTLIERALDATSEIVVATAIVNMWTNDAASIARSYERIDAKHPGRFLLGVGIGHPESITRFHSPYDTMVSYLDELDVAVPADRRILAALGDRSLRLARDRAAGAHPYLVVPGHTRHARDVLGPGVLLAPEHKVVVSADAGHARAIARDFVADPYLGLRNYVNNLLRHGFSAADIADGGSDGLIDALVIHGTPEAIAARLTAHLEAGADHVGVQVLVDPGHDPMPGYRQLAKALFSDRAGTPRRRNLRSVLG